MTLARTALWVAMLALAADGLRAFPAEADARARAVCEPLKWLAAAATAVSSSMDERGQLRPVAGQPWRHDVHGSCVRLAERAFRAIA